MKLAIARLRIVLADTVGWEGAFVTLGALLLAVGSSYWSPAGPWIVIGSISLVLGLAIVIAPSGRNG